MKIEHEVKTHTGNKIPTGGKNLSRVKRYARTPGGANLGERVIRNGEWCLRHKEGKKYEDLSPESIAESISGRKVDHIVYKVEAEELVI